MSSTKRGGQMEIEWIDAAFDALARIYQAVEDERRPGKSLAVVLTR